MTHMQCLQHIILTFDEHAIYYWNSMYFDFEILFGGLGAMLFSRGGLGIASFDSHI